MLKRTYGLTLAAVVLAFAGMATPSRADVVAFVHDYEGWLEAVGGVANEIDFETLPDGSPSEEWVEITEDFNYTDQGVTFSLWDGGPSPGYALTIGHELVTGFSLRAWSFDPTSGGIQADLVVPGSAVGVFFSGFTTFSVFDENGASLWSETVVGPDLVNFIGVVSDESIAFTTHYRGGRAELIQSYVFAPVPEPASGCLLMVGLLAMLRRRRGAGPLPHPDARPPLSVWRRPLPRSPHSR